MKQNIEFRKAKEFVDKSKNGVLKLVQKMGQGGDDVNFDYNKLRGRIRETFGTEEAFAKKLGMSRTSLSQRLNNRSEFSQKEMNKCCVLLGIDLSEIKLYFFTLKVQKTEQNN